MPDNVVSMPRKQKRLNVNINRQTEDALSTYCAEHQVTVTEAIRRLVIVGAYVLNESSKGNELRLGNDKVRFEV